MKKNLWIVILFAGILAGSETAGMAGAFLRYGLDARSESLGRAVTADISSAYSVFFNPANSFGIDERQVLTGMKILAMDRNFAYLSFSQPLEKNTAVTAGILYTGTGDIEGRDKSGTQFATYSYNENLFYLSLGIQPKTFVSIGFSAKLLWARFPEFDANEKTVSSLTFAYDAGALINIPSYEGLYFGIVVRNVKGKNSWDSSKVWTDGTASTDYYPATYSLGVSWKPVFNPEIGLYGDINSHDFKGTGYGLGIEWERQFRNKYGVAFRMGTISGNLSFGFGYEFVVMDKKMIVDYSYTNEGITDFNPHSLSWRFFL